MYIHIDGTQVVITAPEHVYGRHTMQSEPGQNVTKKGRFTTGLGTTDVGQYAYWCSAYLDL
jgi:hypothetical protein